MGQNQSSEKHSHHASASSRSSTPHTERKISRRISQQLRHTTPIDAAATRETAQGTTTTSTYADRDLGRHFHSISSDSSRDPVSRVERSASRTQRDKEASAMPIATHMSNPPSATSIDIPTPAQTKPKTPREVELRNNEPFDDRDYAERPSAPISALRPPRMPIRIAETVQPDSPNLGPLVKNDSDIIPLYDDGDAQIPRRNSMLSVTTQEEEDVAEELQPFGVGYTGQTVPYTIEWTGDAEKVFVTGTFAAWDKKYRLRRTDSNGHFKTVINLPPGTHHLKFFVDNNMVVSPYLPTAVDFNNILVNYIEISTEDIPPTGTGRRESTQAPYQASPGLDPDASGTATPREERETGFEDLKPAEKPEGDFRQIIPQALVDIDLPEEDERWRNASQLIQDAAAPPSLPMFLSKSILNGNLAIKDDGSVLNLPNHTVLNHLMTSNVRNGVLATSVTTRYKKKYVTTISFKPVPKPSERSQAS